MKSHTATSTLDGKGVLFALLAYGAWGLFPIYWKGFGAIPAVEVISHRLVWSLVFLTTLSFAFGQLKECWRIFCAPRLLAVLAGTATLLSINWVLFVYGVNSNQVVETSLGYFINPLLTVALGFVILREQLNRWQVLAVVIAASGVLYFGYHLWKVPWIALGIASSFGLYGLLRKMVPVDPLPGLVVETALMTPAAVIILVIIGAKGNSHFLHSANLTALFLGGGVVTAFPLIWFISAAKRLPLSTLGFLQYLAPTLQLLVGVLIFKESFAQREAISFGLIWLAIAIFLLASKQKKPSVECEPL